MSEKFEAFAKMMGCGVDAVKSKCARNAVTIAQDAEKASKSKSGKYRGYTRDQYIAMAEKFKKLSQ